MLVTGALELDCVDEVVAPGCDCEAGSSDSTTPSRSDMRPGSNEAKTPSRSELMGGSSEEVPPMEILTAGVMVDWVD